MRRSSQRLLRTPKASCRSEMLKASRNGSFKEDAMFPGESAPSEVGIARCQLKDARDVQIEVLDMRFHQKASVSE